MRRPRKPLALASVALLPALALAPACRSGLDEPAPLPALDEAYFRCRVQPVLTKSCGAFACHGDARRYFHMFARSRLRLGGTEEQRNGLMRDQERAFNFDAARAMVSVDEPDESLLLRKPLETSAGGYYHGAVPLGSSNIFPNKDDPDYKTLAAWASGAKEDPACVEPGSDL